MVGSGIEVAQAFARRLGKGAHCSVFRNFGTAQVKWHHRVEHEGENREVEEEFEFVGARKESYSHDSRKPIVEDGTLDDDQRRRDFTINALALCLNKARFAELVDPFEALARNKERIGIISGERIIDELNKIMLAPHPSKGFVDLHRCGLLDIILPELTALDIVEERNGRKHKNNFYHTLEVLENLVARQAEIEAQGKTIPHDHKLYLRWATLLHDIGKPRSKRWDAKVGWTFHNHNYLGMRMVKPLFRRLKLPLDERLHYVERLVDLHMRPINIADDGVTDSAVRRLLFEAGDDIDDLMMLCEADITSKNERRKRGFHENYRLVRQKLVDLEEKDRIRNFQPPVNGDEIMRLFNLRPCAEIGALKSALKDAILDGVVPNEHDAALAFIVERAKRMGLTPVVEQS